MDKISVQDEIQELNLTYLLLVQRMLNEDRATAMFRFKINGAMADLLQSLSAKQLAQLARSNQVLFGLHFSNAGQLARATSNQHEQSLSQVHAALLLASSPRLNSVAAA
ncbi:MAG: flagellar transcriptional regulator FlhD [Porticoccaceae bacterium]